MDKTLYTEDSIQKLDPLSFTRLRPDTYLGSNEDSTQLVREIVTNAYDEFLAGNCTEIWVDYDETQNIVQVRDNGQGILPSVRKEDGRTVLEMVYGDINVSGKYDKSETAVYKVSTGAFGIGASLTNFLSHWLKAITVKGDKYEEVFFEEGRFKNRLEGKHTPAHGVTVTFKPSEEFFRDAHPNVDKLREEFFNMSCICAGLTIHFNGEDYYHPQGIKELLSKKVEGTTSLISNPFLLEKTEENQYLNFALEYTAESSNSIDCFCNYSIIESGTPVTAVKTCITRTLNNWAREQGLLKEKDKNLDGSSIQEGMKIIFNLASPNIRYDSQTKVRVTSTEDNNFITSTLGHDFEVWLDSNPQDGKIIIEKALLARKAAEAAKKAREAVKSQKKSSNNKVKILHPDKLKDAEFLGQDSILLCVEGNSAAASIAVARDVTKYGILALRGKMINSITNKEERLLKNEEIQLLLQALNIIPGEYDSSKLRYGRVGICTDSDSDGFHCGLLVMTALYHFCPQFIEEGRLCWLRSPLYIVKNKKAEDYYFTDEEMNKARENGISGEVQRNKGLGSLSPEQARNSMFGEVQRMDTLMPSPEAFTALEKLMGKDAEIRKQFIIKNIDFSEVKE